MFGTLFVVKKTRYFLFLLIASGALLGSACIHRVNVNEVLPVKDQLSTDQLIALINAYSQTQTFSAQADVTVWNYFTGEGAKADEFPAATGLIRSSGPMTPV